MPHHLFAAEYHGKQAVGLLFLAGAKRDLTCHRNIANVAACMYHSCVAAHSLPDKEHDPFFALP